MKKLNMAAMLVMLIVGSVLTFTNLPKVHFTQDQFSAIGGLMFFFLAAGIYMGALGEN